MDPTEIERNLASQLAMTPETWALMRSHGVTEQTLLELDLFFYGPSEAQAHRLALELKEQRGFEATVEAHEGKFSVKAKIPPRTFNEAALLQLTRDMCELGARHGAEFDGWGAPLPASPPSIKPWWKLW